MSALTGEYIKVLLIEDDPHQALLFKRLLRKKGAPCSKVLHVETMEQAVQKDGQEHFDVCLLDLSLPDTQGARTVDRAIQGLSARPIVILTGTNDQELASRALRMGVQDYLLKGEITSDLLIRSIRYAIERHRLRMKLEQARQQEQQERELRLLGKLSLPSQTVITAKAYGQIPLKDAYPDIFEQLKQTYQSILEMAMEQQAFKVEHETSGRLRDLGEKIGYLKGGPRDVIELHTAALEAKTRASGADKAAAYTEESRLTLLELMGYLASYYRNISLGVGRRNGPTRPGTERRDNSG